MNTLKTFVCQIRGLCTRLNWSYKGYDTDVTAPRICNMKDHMNNIYTSELRVLSHVHIADYLFLDLFCIISSHNMPYVYKKGVPPLFCDICISHQEDQTLDISSKDSLCYFLTQKFVHQDNDTQDMNENKGFMIACLKIFLEKHGNKKKDALKGILTNAKDAHAMIKKVFKKLGITVRGEKKKIKTTIIVVRFFVHHAS